MRAFFHHLGTRLVQLSGSGLTWLHTMPYPSVCFSTSSSTHPRICFGCMFCWYALQDLLRGSKCACCVMWEGLDGRWVPRQAGSCLCPGPPVPYGLGRFVCAFAASGWATPLRSELTAPLSCDQNVLPLSVATRTYCPLSLWPLLMPSLYHLRN